MRFRMLVAALLALALPLSAEEKEQEKQRNTRVRITVGGGSPLLKTHFAAPSLNYNRGASIFSLLDEASHKFTRGTIYPQGANADAYVLGGPTPNIQPGDTYLLYGHQSTSVGFEDNHTYSMSVDSRIAGSLWLQTGYQMGSQAAFTFTNTRDFINVTRVDQIHILPPRVLHIGMDRRYIDRQDEFKVRGHALSVALKYDLLGNGVLGLAPLVGAQYTLARSRHWSVQRDSWYTHFVAEELAGGFPNGMADLRTENSSDSGERSITYAHRWQTVVGLDLRLGARRSDGYSKKGYREDAPVGIFIQTRYAFGDNTMRISPETPYGTVRLTAEVERWYVFGGLIVGF